MLIDEYKIIPLKYRVFHVCKSNNQLLLANKNTITILDEKYTSIFEINLKEAIVSIEFCANKNMIIYSTETEIKIINYSNEEIKTIQDSGNIFIKNEHVWVVSSVNEDTFSIKVYQIKTGEKVTSLNHADIFGSSNFILNKGPNSSLVLMVAAGQDGWRDYLVRLDENEIKISKIGAEFSYIGAFNKEGDRYILVDEYDMQVLSYPEGSLLATFSFQDYSTELTFIEPFAFISNTKILFMAESGMYIFCVEKSAIITKVIIENHEPKPTSYYYPLLQNDDELTTDMNSFSLYDNELIIFSQNNINKPTTYNLIVVDRSKIDKNV